MSESRIYTKLGDDGSTGLLFGGRTSKADPLIDTIGAIDEAVSALGLARATCAYTDLAEAILGVQRDLFVAAADLAANPRARDRLVPGVSLLTAQMVARLEATIDRLVADHPLHPVFVVPGANLPSAALDLARTAVRRAERRLVACEHAAGRAGPANPQVGVYLNRASDLVYVLARRAAGDAEEPASHGPVSPPPAGDTATDRPDPA